MFTFLFTKNAIIIHYVLGSYWLSEYALLMRQAECVKTDHRCVVVVVSIHAKRNRLGGGGGARPAVANVSELTTTSAS